VTASFVLQIVLQYVLVPGALLAAATLCLRRPSAPSRLPRWLAWVLIGTFVVTGGVMGWLRYLSYHTAYFDLGTYDQRIWWLSRMDLLSTLGSLLPELGHFSPVLLPHVLIFKLHASALVLIWLQVVAVAAGAYPVYRLAERRLGTRPALAFAAAYLLYPPVWFTVLHDFHPDHLVLPLLLFAFDALDRGRTGAALLLTFLVGLVKETMVLTAVAFGLYALLGRRRLRVWHLVMLGGLVVFALVILAVYGDVVRQPMGAASYGYLGGNLREIVRTLFLAPATWMVEATRFPKLHFLFVMLAPLALLPLLAPGVLAVAVPALALALLSQWGPRYQIWAQYVNPVVPPLVVAAILGYQRVLTSSLARRLAPDPAARERWLTGCLIAAAVYFNVLLSPSPISTTFWLGWAGLPAQTRWPPGALAPVRSATWLAHAEWVRWPLHRTAYVVGERERRIRDALSRIPADPDVSVSAQNNLNSSHLAHRRLYKMFPWEADYIAVDTRRPPWVYPDIDPEAYAAAVADFRRRRPLLHDADGLLIFGPERGPAQRR
jgi:uncharacterized membrane protein